MVKVIRSCTMLGAIRDIRQAKRKVKRLDKIYTTKLNKDQKAMLSWEFPNLVIE